MSRLLEDNGRYREGGRSLLARDQAGTGRYPQELWQAREEGRATERKRG
jgi:hypothetical protein